MLEPTIRAMALGILVAVVLAIVVLIRTVLSFSLQIEIEGVAPWKRALMTSPQLIARAAASRPVRRRGSADTAE